MTKDYNLSFIQSMRQNQSVFDYQFMYVHDCDNDEYLSINTHTLCASVTMTKMKIKYISALCTGVSKTIISNLWVSNARLVTMTKINKVRINTRAYVKVTFFNSIAAQYVRVYDCARLKYYFSPCVRARVCMRMYRTDLKFFRVHVCTCVRARVFRTHS